MAIAGKAKNAEANLDKYELERRLGELAHDGFFERDHRAALDQLAAEAALFGPPKYDFMFAMRNSSGKLIASSPPEFGALMASWPPATESATFFRLTAFGQAGRNYNGITRLVSSVSGPVMVSVATAGDDDHFTRTVVKEFLFEIAWIIPLVDGIVLFVAILGLRRGLRSLQHISTIAAGIGPRDAGVRLPTENLPSELKPLVFAFNQALKRLDDGLGLLRRFTANAAHELRNPLAVLTAEIESIESQEGIGHLREDVVRMNRMVTQLLQVARLDNVPLEVCADVDLNSVAASVVAQLAPLAIAEGKKLAFLEAPKPVIVRGNAYAIADAVRNLVENAISFTAPGTEVEVAVNVSGHLTVADRGPGVPPDYRERIFERFWRGPSLERSGAGLGLAIVREIMEMHRGEVKVSDNPAGGAIFSLTFATDQQK
jgi:signal transduction histidine kinase